MGFLYSRGEGRQKCDKKGDSVPPQTQYADFMQTTFFYLGRFLKKLADDQCSSVTKGSINHINSTKKKPFTSSGLTRNWIFNGSIYYALYLQILRFYSGRLCARQIKDVRTLLRYEIMKGVTLAPLSNIRNTAPFYEACISNCSIVPT